MPNTLTDRDARLAISTYLVPFTDDFDIEAIADEVHALTGGWDIDEVPSGQFSAIIARHDISNRPSSPTDSPEGEPQ